MKNKKFDYILHLPSKMVDNRTLTYNKSQLSPLSDNGDGGYYMNFFFLADVFDECHRIFLNIKHNKKLDIAQDLKFKLLNHKKNKYYAYDNVGGDLQKIFLKKKIFISHYFLQNYKKKCHKQIKISFISYSNIFTLKKLKTGVVYFKTFKKYIKYTIIIDTKIFDLI